ncbi:MAG: 30S ribosomal protein S18 [Deltaproteobacteria bacterium]
MSETQTPKTPPRSAEGRGGSEGRPEGRADDRRSGRPEGGLRPRPRRRFGGRSRRKVCRFCANKTLKLDYKWADVLRDFVSERGRIVPSRTTGTCAKHQRKLKIAIKRARNVALLAYTDGGTQKRESRWR